MYQLEPYKLETYKLQTYQTYKLQIRDIQDGASTENVEVYVIDLVLNDFKIDFIVIVLYMFYR